MADAMPVKVKRALYRGMARTWTHVIERNVGTEAEPVWEPVDITDWTFRAQFRADLNRGEVVASSVCTIVDGPNGIVREKLTGEEADKLPGQTDPAEKPIVYWDLESINADGDPETWKYAYVPVTGDASHG